VATAGVGLAPVREEVRSAKYQLQFIFANVSRSPESVPPCRELTFAAATRVYDLSVAYDEALAQRIRDLAADTPNVTEKKMFGGLAFLVGGNMAIAASGQGGILVRVDPEESSSLVATTPAEVMIMRGRPMEGWLRLTAADVRTTQSLASWVKRGTMYAASLPAK
jgi:TfoX/Sxy family transcriptional regulator of competence genes